MKIKEKIVLLPDIHTPNHHVESVNAVLEFIKDYKPTHLFQLGDFCDWDSFTSYDPRRSSDIINVEEEVESANKLLDKIDSAVPKNCKKVMMGGNHEARVPKYLAKYEMEIQHRRLAKKIVSWQSAYRLDERGWKHCEYGDVWPHGKFLISHGWFTGGDHAKKHLQLYHKNFFYGHCHEYKVSVENGFDGEPVMAMCIGTLSKFNLSYLVGKPPVNWIHMFATIDVMENGKFTPIPVPIIDGKFVRGGKLYGI